MVWSRWKLGLVGGLICGTFGCTTMMPPDPTVVSFQSTPPGASVSVNGVPVGNTPVTQHLSCQRRQEVTFALEGYHAYAQPIPTVSGLDGFGIQWPVDRCAPVVSVVLQPVSSSARR